MAKLVPTMKVEVRSRQGVLFDGELKAVTSFNSVGQFDILAQHSNFVSMISKKLILHRADGRREELNVDTGVVIVENNEVKIFVGVGKV